MSAILVFVGAIVLLSCRWNNVYGREIFDDDSKFAASDKHEKWKKGVDTDHYETSYAKNDETDERAHESKHRFGNSAAIR